MFVREKVFTAACPDERAHETKICLFDELTNRRRATNRTDVLVELRRSSGKSAYTLRRKIVFANILIVHDIVIHYVMQEDFYDIL